MVSATFTGAIISSFEDALSVCAVLVAYIPMLMDTGGNAGSQASVTVIRGLSLNEIEYRDVPKVVFKEIRVALICGITLSAANFVKLLLLDKVGVLVAASVCPDSGSGGSDRNDHWMPSADPGKASRLRSGGHGKSVYHHHRGCNVTVGIFPRCICNFRALNE